MTKSYCLAVLVFSFLMPSIPVRADVYTEAVLVFADLRQGGPVGVKEIKDVIKQLQSRIKPAPAIDLVVITGTQVESCQWCSPYGEGKQGPSLTLTYPEFNLKDAGTQKRIWEEINAQKGPVRLRNARRESEISIIAHLDQAIKTFSGRFADVHKSALLLTSGLTPQQGHSGVGKVERDLHNNFSIKEKPSVEVSSYEREAVKELTKYLGAP